MIVNPGLPGAEAVFLGEDAGLRELSGLRQEGEIFLGKDGTLYMLRAVTDLRGYAAKSGRLPEARFAARAQLFLGEDGTLYESVEP